MSTAQPLPMPLYRRLYQGWMAVAGAFAEVQTIVIVTLVYLLVIGPASIIGYLLRHDPLAKRMPAAPGSVWNEADTVSKPELERAKRPF